MICDSSKLGSCICIVSQVFKIGCINKIISIILLDYLHVIHKNN